MRILLLGGSWFLGRAIAEHALAQGWHVTTFNRGRSGNDVDGVQIVRGDRRLQEDMKRLIAAGPWDAVVDTSGFVPRDVLSAARLLAGTTEHYVFVSTVSVYQRWPVEPLSEESPVLDAPADAGPDHGYDGPQGYPTRYGFGKAGAERAVLREFGAGNVTILRPGVILGPQEYVGRLPWWLRRIHKGGLTLAPGGPDQKIQPVDVRDVARFALHCAVTHTTGIFNVTAPKSHATFGAMLAACVEVTESDARIEWVPDSFLTSHAVRQWTELPLWRTFPGAWEVDGTRAYNAGLRCRPLAETVVDTWTWMTAGGQLVEHERAGEIGMDPKQEHALLAAFAASPGMTGN